MPHSHQPYPAFDLECLREVVRIARGGTLAAERKTFCKCGYEIIGAILNVAVGEPDVPGPFAGKAETPSLVDLEDCCGAFLDAQPLLTAYGADESGVDPAMVALLIQFAIEALKLLIARRRQ